MFRNIIARRSSSLQVTGRRIVQGQKQLRFAGNNKTAASTTATTSSTTGSTGSTGSTTLKKKDVYDTAAYKKINNVWDGIIHEKVLSYYSVKKSVDATYLYQKCFFSALGIEEDRFNEVHADCLFLTGLFYLIDKTTEEPGTNESNIMQKLEWELDFSIRWMKEAGYYTKPVAEHFDNAIKYIQNEQVFVRKTPTKEQWFQMWKWKTSDIRILGCIVTKHFTGKDEPSTEVRNVIDEIFWFAEAVMDVRDLQKDVEQNALNIYKFYVRWYGPNKGRSELWKELQDSKQRALKLIDSTIHDEKTKSNLLRAGHLWWDQLSQLPPAIHDPHDENLKKTEKQ
jgi:hypothetical protein